MSADLIRDLESRSMTAWPSFQTIIDDGWVQRFAGGYSGRANSVYPLYPGPSTRCIPAWTRSTPRLTVPKPAIAPWASNQPSS